MSIWRREAWPQRRIDPWRAVRSRPPDRSSPFPRSASDRRGQPRSTESSRRTLTLFGPASNLYPNVSNMPLAVSRSRVASNSTSPARFTTLSPVTARTCSCVYLRVLSTVRVSTGQLDGTAVEGASFLGAAAFLASARLGGVCANPAPENKKKIGRTVIFPYGRRTAMHLDYEIDGLRLASRIKVSLFSARVVSSARLAPGGGPRQGKSAPDPVYRPSTPPDSTQ